FGVLFARINLHIRFDKGRDGVFENVLSEIYNCHSYHQKSNQARTFVDFEIVHQKQSGDGSKYRVAGHMVHIEERNSRNDTYNGYRHYRFSADIPVKLIAEIKVSRSNRCEGDINTVTDHITEIPLNSRHSAAFFLANRTGNQLVNQQASNDNSGVKHRLQHSVEIAFAADQSPEKVVNIHRQTQLQHKFNGQQRKWLEKEEKE